MRKVTGIQWQKASLLVSVLIAGTGRGTGEALCASFSCGLQGQGPQSSQQLLSEWGTLLQPWCSNQPTRFQGPFPCSLTNCKGRAKPALPCWEGRADICRCRHSHPKARAFLLLKGWHWLQVIAVKHDTGVWAILTCLYLNLKAKILNHFELETFPA